MCSQQSGGETFLSTYQEDDYDILCPTEKESQEAEAAVEVEEVEETAEAATATTAATALATAEGA